MESSHQTAHPLGDRRSAHLRLAEAVRCLRELRQPTAVILAEIDPGPGPGDVDAAAAALEGGLRLDDFVGRWVGDELICILPRCGVKDAEKVAERMRAKVPLSCGVTEVRIADRAEDTVERAGQLMRKSRAMGRNRISAG